MNMTHHFSALNNVLIDTAVLHYVPSDATSDSDRTIVQASLRCSHMQELKNDEKERARLSTVASILMVWTELPDNSVKITEQHRVLIGGIDFRIRKVKAWPVIDPVFYELHVEDET